MVDSTTRAAVCRTSAAPDGTRRRGPCHQHCSPSACTARHPQPTDIRHTPAAESTIELSPMPPDPPNAIIAALFDELADLYELDGAVVHRVLAYRNAAKSVREAPQSVAALTREGKVTSLPGIGRTLEEKINALLETGTVPAVEKLRAKFPPGLVDMTRLPGLGPKRARKLFDELGIDSLPALKEAAEAQKLRGIRGFGPK